jgi:hypothetical protein
MQKHRWFAIDVQASRAHEMSFMSRENMNKLYNKPETYQIFGIPAYFDEDGRVWPTPLSDYICVAKSL